MAFGGQMDDAVHLLVLHQFIESVEVADIHLHKLIVRLVFDVLQVSEVSSIREFVEIDDVIVGILVHEEANYMTSDESGTAGNDNCSHILFCLIISFLM